MALIVLRVITLTEAETAPLSTLRRVWSVFLDLRQKGIA